jgi:hypothetical protein
MRFLKFLASALLLVTGATRAAVNDTLPADYFPMEPGASTFAVYVVDRHSAGPYKNGQKLLDGTLNTQYSVVRLTHVMRVAGQPIALVGVLPWSHSSVGPAPLATALGPEVSGLGDVRFGATGWLVSNKDSGEFVGVTGLLFLPTGSYTPNQVLNVGENRHKVTLNVGWIHPLSPSFVLEVLPEVAWFGDNTNYLGGRTLSQETAYALTSYLRYRATPNWQFHLGAQINRGGETRINGLDQNNAPDNTRLMLGTTYLTDDKKSQWIMRFAQDTRIKNGFATESEILVRYLKPF